MGLFFCRRQSCHRKRSALVYFSRFRSSRMYGIWTSSLTALSQKTVLIHATCYPWIATICIPFSFPILLLRCRADNTFQAQTSRGFGPNIIEVSCGVGLEAHYFLKFSPWYICAHLQAVSLQEGSLGKHHPQIGRRWYQSVFVQGHFYDCIRDLRELSRWCGSGTHAPWCFLTDASLTKLPPDRQALIYVTMSVDMPRTRCKWLCLSGNIRNCVRMGRVDSIWMKDRMLASLTGQLTSRWFLRFF